MPSAQPLVPGATQWPQASPSGVCMQGDVANFVETEQLIEVGGDGLPVISSFVVVRGSIPLLWSQIPNIKYKPTTLIAPLQTSDAPFDRHVRELIEKYKVSQTRAPALHPQVLPENCRIQPGVNFSSSSA